MTGFAQARLVESRAMTVLEPFLLARGDRYVLTDKGRLARFMQEQIGDLLMNDRNGKLWSVEVKSEQRFTGNLFLETWSNRNLDDLFRHAEVGSNPGWLHKSRADILFYHFLDHDKLYVFNLFALKRWAFNEPSQVRASSAEDAAGFKGPLLGRIYDFREIRQSKYKQMNDTWGRIVPIKVLEKEVRPPPKLLHPRQICMDFGEPTAA